MAILDYRSLCVQMVEVCQSAVIKAAAGKVQSYTVEGQSFTYRTADEAREALMFWQRELARLSHGMIGLVDMRNNDGGLS